MTRIDEVKRLQEMEAKATPGPWRLVEYSEDDIQIESDDPEFLINLDSSDVPDGKLITSSRNNVGWLLALASKFQPGDAEAIGRIADFMGIEIKYYIDNPDRKLAQADIACLRRLQEAAQEMERSE